MRTNMNYHVRGTCSAAIFLSNYHSLYAPITSDECHTWFHLFGLSWPAMSWKLRSAWIAKKRQNEKFLLTVGLEPTTLRSIPASSVVRGAVYDSQECRFESYCGQEILIFDFFRFQRSPRRSTEPIQIKSSIAFIRGNRCIESMIIWKNNGGNTRT